ncbi:MAG: NTP pyrophosphohydrolase [Parcubacteria group bacterium Gr01-1014_48]|nr:MAG: NTP pyrophosphohydrolase [Parcubacteria group bacterium Gr01-1014_48]
MVERSAGMILFKNTKTKKQYLLLQHHPRPNVRIKNIVAHWDFPKGHLEKGEEAIDAAIRESKEETGIEIAEFFPDFKTTIRYFIRSQGVKSIPKFVVFFLGKAKGGRVTLSFEHQAYAWLSFREAHMRLTYENAKKVLKKADDYLSAKGI